MGGPIYGTLKLIIHFCVNFEQIFVTKLTNSKSIGITAKDNDRNGPWWQLNISKWRDLRHKFVFKVKRKWLLVGWSVDRSIDRSPGRSVDWYCFSGIVAMCGSHASYHLNISLVGATKLSYLSVCVFLFFYSSLCFTFIPLFLLWMGTQSAA